MAKRTFGNKLGLGFGVTVGLALIMGAASVVALTVVVQAKDDAAIERLLADAKALEKAGVKTRVLSAIQMQQVAEPFIRRRAVRHFEKGRVVIFAGGTGNPYFSTDTAAALRASEMGANVLLKATKVDGIYDSDPLKNSKARKFDHITYLEALRKRLRVMDSTAFSLCMDNRIPIVVFNMFKERNLRRVLLGEKIGTIVSD